MKNLVFLRIVKWHSDWILGTTKEIANCKGLEFEECLVHRTVWGLSDKWTEFERQSLRDKSGP